MSEYDNDYHYRRDGDQSPEDWNDQWKREHDFKIRWQCPQCRAYEYQEEENCNRSLPCPDCGVKCVEIGESYAG